MRERNVQGKYCKFWLTVQERQYLYTIIVTSSCDDAHALQEGPSLQLPLSTFPSPSFPSTYPGGQYTEDSVHRRVLCSAIAAFVKQTTFSGFAITGLRNSLHLREIIEQLSPHYR